jgi:predicted peptidase
MIQCIYQERWIALQGVFLHMKKIILLLSMAALLFSGCQSEAETILNESTPPSQVICESTQSSDSEPTCTEAATTAPDLSLQIAPGSYLLRYEDENTSNYLDYYLHIPENAEINMPIIVFLHGDGEVGKVERLENYAMMQSAREIYGDAFPFIAISPCTRIPSWTEGSIPETLMGLVDATIEQCSANPERIILTGHSRGAIGVWYLISTYGDYFRAAVPVSCGADTAMNYENLSCVPILAIAGTSGDNEIRFQTQMISIVTKIQENGGNAEMKVLEGCTHIDTSTKAYTEEIFHWMLQQ